MAKLHKVAYKFLKAGFVPALMERGVLRIGTAAEFREADGLEGGRSDPDELSAEWHPGAVTIPVKQDHPFVSWYGLKVPKVNRDVNLQIAAGTVFRRVASAYIFCASHELTSNMTKRMAEVFGYDACVRIKDFPQFAALISADPSLQGRFPGLNRVTYRASIAVTDLSETGEFVKQLGFGWQKEVRIIWGGENIPETGHLIEVPQITPLLRRVY